MIKKLSAILLLIIIADLLSGCGKEAPDTFSGSYDDGYSNLRAKYYYDPYMEGTYRQVWKINMVDGSILTACPDALCSHDETCKTCPFYDIIPVRTADAGRYFFYIGYGKVNGLIKYAIYCFDTETSASTMIYTYDKFPSVNPDFIYGDGRLYFDIPKLRSSDGNLIETVEHTLMYYDTKTGKIGKFGDKDEQDRLLFADKGKVYYRDASGEVYVSSGNFSDSEPLPLPDSGVSSVFGGYWECGPGYIAKSYPPGDIYLYDEKRSVTLPPEASGGTLIGLTATDDTFCFTLSTTINEGSSDGRYTVRICVLDRSGTYRLYAVQSDFDFYVRKCYNDRVVCSVLSEYSDGSELIPGAGDESTQNNLIWIDLQSGKASLYNTYSDSVINMRLGDITVRTERLK